MGWISRLVGGGSREIPKNGSKFGNSKNVSPDVVATSKLEESHIRETAEADMDRELFQFNLPAQERGFTDILTQHKSGSKLQYVGLTAPPSETMAGRVSRLLLHTAKLSRNELPLADIPQLKLIGTMEKYPLSSVLPKKGHDYVLLKKVTCVYVPMTSFKDKYTGVKISIMDMRHRGQEEKRSVTLSSNLPYNFEFCMDYCFPRASANKVFISVVLERAIVNTGEEWGALQVQLQIEQTTFPYVEPFQETTGAMILPSTGLDIFERDPAHVNLLVTDRHRELMARMKQEGDVIDIDEIHRARLARPQYTKSSVAPQQSTLKLEPSPYSVNPNLAKFLIPDDQVSLEPQEYGFTRKGSPPPDPNEAGSPFSSSPSLSLNDDDELNKMLNEASKNTQENVGKAKKHVDFKVMDV